MLLYEHNYILLEIEPVKPTENVKKWKFDLSSVIKYFITNFSRHCVYFYLISCFHGHCSDCF